MKTDLRRFALAMAALAVLAVVSAAYGVWLLALPAVLAFAVLVHRRSREHDGAKPLSPAQYAVFLSVIVATTVTVVVVQGW